MVVLPECISYPPSFSQALSLSPLQILVRSTVLIGATTGYLDVLIYCHMPLISEEVLQIITLIKLLQDNYVMQLDRVLNNQNCTFRWLNTSIHIIRCDDLLV